MVAVHHEVDRDLALVGIGPPHRQGADHRPTFGSQHLKAVQGERRWKGRDVDVVAEEQDLAVGIGKLVGHECVEPVAAEHNSHDVRRYLLGPHHLEAVYGPS